MIMFAAVNQLASRCRHTNRTNNGGVYKRGYIVVPTKDTSAARTHAAGGAYIQPYCAAQSSFSLLLPPLIRRELLLLL